MLRAENIAMEYGMMSPEEVRLLKRMVRELPINPIIVNIGAGFGTSAAAMLEERSDAFIFSVDREEKPVERTNLIKCGLDFTRCVRILGVSWDVGKHFPIQIPALFVDGGHSHTAITKDIKAWFPKVQSGGLVFFHDYNHSKAPDVTTVVNSRMAGITQILGEERYLIAYRKI